MIEVRWQNVGFVIEEWIGADLDHVWVVKICWN